MLRYAAFFALPSVEVNFMAIVELVLASGRRSWWYFQLGCSSYHDKVQKCRSCPHFPQNACL